MILYEIYTGLKPFEEITTDLGLVTAIVTREDNHLRPPKNSTCWNSNGGSLTAIAWEVLTECWNKHQEKRPTLLEIYQRLHLDDVVDTRTRDNWPLAARFNDLHYSAQFVAPEAIEGMVTLIINIDTSYFTSPSELYNRNIC
ncbi:hypothetical protein BDQ17DRAFT_1329640 [Cyathus striatus]|nr:hypothetical protein BDQ17DRAFT_1329640 [Cyathus striatus]